jgi:hypothetical protein
MAPMLLRTTFWVARFIDKKAAHKKTLRILRSVFFAREPGIRPDYLQACLHISLNG